MIYISLKSTKTAAAAAKAHSLADRLGVQVIMITPIITTMLRYPDAVREAQMFDGLRMPLKILSVGSWTSWKWLAPPRGCRGDTSDRVS